MRSSLPVLLALALTAAAAPAAANSDACHTNAVGQSCTCDVLSLHPTQFTVGFEEVEAREKKIAALDPAELAKLESKDPEPVVKGPDRVLYIIDHHHLARILADLKIAQTKCQIVGDLSDRSPQDFVAEMTKRNWLYLDENGAPKDASELPTSVLGLKDDPYRSLAGLVGKKHGFKKSDEPFAEFKWAAYFRQRTPIDDVQNHPEKALEAALDAAKSKEACGLPGYKGPAC